VSPVDVTGPNRTTDTPEHDRRYQQLVELAPDGILIHDGERIVLANSAAVRLAGATQRDQLVGQPIDAFLDPPYLKAVQTLLLESGDLVPRIMPVRDTFRRLDGSEIQVDVTAIAFLDHDHLSAHLVVRDVTEQIAMEQAARQAEEHLHQAQKMDTVGALAGGVAHEVNNMMSVILGLGEFLLQDPAIPSAWLPDVQAIMDAAGRAATVTRQLLSFSRRAFHQPRAVDLAVALRGLEALLRRLLGEGRTLILRTDDTPLVWADPGQLEQVIVNLALNARDAMPDGGTLTVTVREVAVTQDVLAADGAAIPAGHYALLVVEDSGVGMDPATQARAFEPFFTTKPAGEGTGLGLAAVYGIMTQNDGYVALSSGPGHGTTFTLYLPLFAGREPVERRKAAPPPIRNALPTASTVLVVDDEPHVLSVAARSLERSGFHVLRASDGRSALEMVDGHGPPDLVLTDLMMPGMGGVELGRRLKQLWPALPVLYMSGYSVEDLRREGVTGVERELVHKPFTPDSLVARVTATLSSAAGRSPNL
jgi:two-component system cell cycle sensor histidine kinase/response regulator CckA